MGNSKRENYPGKQLRRMGFFVFIYALHLNVSDNEQMKEKQRV